MTQSPVSPTPDADVIVNLTMTGSEVEWTVPDGTVAYLIHPRDGDVTERVVSGADEYFTHKKHCTTARSSLTSEGKKKYFTGASGVILEILVMCGTGQVEFRY